MNNNGAATPMTAVLLGAGGRGIGTTGSFAEKHPEKLKFIAVAEPNEGRRKKFAEIHGIPEDMQFASYQELFAREQLAPLCFNTTMDLEHLESALLALDRGYHLYLEKPMDVTPEGVLSIYKKAVEKRRVVQVCHPLRYTAFYLKIKELLDQQVIGKTVSITMVENVCYWHFAHSFVRGNWGVVEKSGPLILTKTCHDMDIAVWLAGGIPETVASFGKQSMFTRANQPAGAKDRCTDGCPHVGKCPFDAIAMYAREEFSDWPVSAISLDRSVAARRKAIEEGPYGRCVFACDNTACDEQNMLTMFDNGVHVNFAVHGNSMRPSRTIRILGTEGQLDGHLEKNEISYIRFGIIQGDDVKPVVLTEFQSDETDGHFGGDAGAVNNFLKLVTTGDYESANASLKIAVDGHLLSFISEKARAQEKVLNMEEFRNSL